MVIRNAAKKLLEKTAGAKKKPAIKLLEKNEIDDLIREQAYKLYVQRGCTPGDPQEDWREAERIIKNM